VDWRIYYGDGSTFSSEDGAPDDAPALDIQAIAVAQEYERGYVVKGFDYYWYEDGEWYGGEIFGLFDYLIRSGKAKFARTIPTETFRKVIKRATDDPLL